MKKLAVLSCCCAVFALARQGVAVAGAADGVKTHPQHVCYRSFRPQLERTKDFAEMGIPIRCFFAANTINHGGKPYCDYPVIWKGFGEYDWSALDAQIADFLKVSPNAEFLCMIDLNTPYWATHKFWLDSFTDVSHAACDPAWIEKTSRWMLDFIAYAEKTWGSRIRAYILSGGGTSEWYEYDRGRTSRNKDAAWVKWCKSNGVKHGTAVPDQTKIGTAAFENLVYDPQTEADKIDYWKFHNAVIADALLSFAAKARKAVPASKEIGAFFGYYYVSDKRHVSFGHLDYERVFASPDIDFFIAPGNYSERQMGGGSGSQLVHATARRYGKRLLHEIDFGPHTQKRWGAGIWKTLADDIAGNTREAAFAIANGCSYWWFDMWGGKDGFYDDPKLRKRIAKLAGITKRFSGTSPRPADEVLLVADPESLCHLNEKDDKERAFGEYFRNVLSRTGVPFDVCTLSDLKVRDVSNTKVFVCPASINITAEKRALLESKVMVGGKTVVWCYAPGLSDGSTLDVARVKRYAGVDYGTEGISATDMGGWTSVYARDYRLYTSGKLREIIMSAGVAFWASKPTPVFANERFVAIHTKEGGKIAVHLPRRAAKVVDLLADKTVAEDVVSFEADFAAPDTRLFGLSYGKTVQRLNVRSGENLVDVRNRVRAMLKGKPDSAVDVVLAPGEYCLPAGMDFTAADSGTSEANMVTWRSESPGAAKIIGGVRVLASAFSVLDDPALLNRLQPEARGKVLVADVSAFVPDVLPDMPIEFRLPPSPTVFVDGNFGTLARWPNDGYASFTVVADKGRRSNTGGKNMYERCAFVFDEKRPNSWNFNEGVWLNGYWTHDWDSYCVRASGWGAENGTNNVMRLAGAIPYGVKNESWGSKPYRSFFAFNVFEELDSAGEYWLDRRKKRLYVYSPTAAVPHVVIAKSSKPLLRGRGAGNLRFKNLDMAFNHGAIADFTAAENVLFEDCRIHDTMADGICVAGRRIRISQCEVSRCGRRGVVVDGGDRRGLIRSGNVVENSRIHDFSVFQRTYAAGIDLQMTSVGVTVRGNEIFNSPYSAVMYGGNEHLFESNDVHHVVQDTRDAGAFYTGRDWTTQGNVLRGNRIHDIGSGGAQSAVAGFYFDDCDCGDAVYGNEISGVSRGILLGGGRDHPIIDNVFSNCAIGISIDCRGVTGTYWNSLEHGGPSWMLEEKAKRLDYTNGVWAALYPRLANIMNDNPREPLYNPVVSNLFIDCTDRIIKLHPAATPILKRMAPVKDNLVAYTSTTNGTPRALIDRRLVDGFRVVDVESPGNTKH